MYVHASKKGFKSGVKKSWWEEGSFILANLVRARESSLLSEGSVHLTLQVKQVLLADCQKTLVLFVWGCIDGDTTGVVLVVMREIETEGDLVGGMITVVYSIRITVLKELFGDGISLDFHRPIEEVLYRNRSNNIMVVAVTSLVSTVVSACIIVRSVVLLTDRLNLNFSLFDPY